MARRVFVHIGLPKTGTSYLQAIVWPAREQLKAAGVLLPGARKSDHLFASMIVREDANVRRRGPHAPGAWQRIVDDLSGWHGDGLISHEFFCAAAPEQAARMVQDLAPAEVHVVVTTREPLGLFASSWQESLKNRSTVPMSTYGRGESEDPKDVWDWRSLDLGLVLQRWAPAVPAERLHVLAPAPAGADRAELWRRFAALLDIPADTCDASTGFANSSMGVAEAETLRRLNGRLDEFGSARDRGMWIRTYLADERLVPRRGEPFWPGEDQVADARRRGERAYELVRAGSFDVVGDPELLRVPADLPQRRHPDSVTDAEVADVALDLVARLMSDLRAERVSRRTPSPAGRPSMWRRLRAKLPTSNRPSRS